MGKRERVLKAESKRSDIDVVIIDDDDDDDAEANEDLSLKIVEKAMLRKCKDANPVQNGDEIVTNLTDKKKEKKSKKKKKKGEKNEAEVGSAPSEKDGRFEKFCSDLILVDDAKEDEKIDKAAEIIDEAVLTNPVEVSDNIVLRKLLRGPRYFDPPDSSWGTCYNCGEEGHKTINCTSARRKKPCFVCGSLEHNAKQCSKGQDCFICRKGGHRARDCPERNKWGSQNSKLCLKCGDSGHDMFSCGNNYSPDDLKEIQCYICGSFGHLCCVNYSDTGPREVSCYRCGLSGHTGLACSGSRGESTGLLSVSSCFKCGEEGHFARECTNSTKAGKRNYELSTPKRRYFKENRDHMEAKSVPELGKRQKKRKTKYEGGFTSASKPKQRHGWITEDPGDFPNGKARYSDYRSPATPSNKRTNYAASGHASTSYSPRKPHKLNFTNSPSNGSAKFYQHRYSASRFGNGNSSSSGMGRNYDWYY